MQFSPDRIAEIKKAEERRFLATPLANIAVKAAPWSSIGDRFGMVVKPRVPGPVAVTERNGNRHEYASLSEMLNDWIGD